MFKNKFSLDDIFKFYYLHVYVRFYVVPLHKIIPYNVLFYFCEVARRFAFLYDALGFITFFVILSLDSLSSTCASMWKVGTQTFEIFKQH